MINTPLTDNDAGYPDEGGCWKYNPKGEYTSASLTRMLETENTILKRVIEKIKTASYEGCIGDGCLSCGEVNELADHAFKNSTQIYDKE
jgi:hypothetical protein